MMAGQLEKWSWIAGIVSAVFGILAYWKMVSSKDGSRTSQSAGAGSTQIGNNSGTIIIGQTGAPLPPAAPVDIQGKWKDEQAEEIVQTKLFAADWSHPEFEVPLNHDLICASDLIYKDHQSKVLAFKTTPEDFDCHACAPWLSFFEFEKVSHGWSLTNSEIAVLQRGSWGDFPAEWISVRVISDHIYGVFLTSGYTAQGFTTQGVTLYARIGDSFREILSLSTSEDDPPEFGGGGWSSTIEIRPAAAGLYDVVVHRKGKTGPEDLRWVEGPDEGKDDVAGDDDRIRPLDVFKFDGRRYVRSNLFL